MSNRTIQTRARLVALPLLLLGTILLTGTKSVKAQTETDFQNAIKLENCRTKFETCKAKFGIPTTTTDQTETDRFNLAACQQVQLECNNR